MQQSLQSMPPRLNYGHDFARSVEVDFIKELLDTPARIIAAMAENLQTQAEGFQGLCGEILVTLEVNRTRDTLRGIDATASEQFDTILARWQQRQRDLLSKE